MAENSTVPVAKTDGALRRVDPIEMFNAIQDDLERFWRDPFRVGALAFPFRRTPKSIASFMPRMDIYEKDNAIVVKADLPGLKKEDVQVEIGDDNSLIIRGESHAEQEIKDEAFYHVERSVGRFYRRLRLPFEAHPDQIQASMTDGVLEVRITRPAEAHSEPKKIPVA